VRIALTKWRVCPVQEFKLWLSRIPNTEPIMKTDRFERGSYMVFDTATWDCMRKVPCCGIIRFYPDVALL